MTKIDHVNDTKIKIKKTKIAIFLYLFTDFFIAKNDFKKREKNRNSRIARVYFFCARTKILSLPFRAKARLMVTLFVHKKLIVILIKIHFLNLACG